MDASPSPRRERERARGRGGPETTGRSRTVQGRWRTRPVQWRTRSVPCASSSVRALCPRAPAAPPRAREGAEAPRAGAARLREAVGSQPDAQVARRTGFNRETVRRYLSGRVVSVQFVVAVAEGDGVSADGLILGRGGTRPGTGEGRDRRAAPRRPLSDTDPSEGDSVIERAWPVVNPKPRDLPVLSETADVHAAAR